MTVMDWIKIVMMVLGGMGALLVGMKMLSENLTRLSRNKLSALLNKAGTNRFACMGIGSVVTILGQSSAFTTVMVVGLVNAGIMTLFQATAMIMGANVGTTLVTWIVSLSSIEITVFFLAFAAVGMLVSMISSKEKTKALGSALAGFGLIFVGLSVMKGAMTFQPNSAAFEVMSNAFNKITNPFLLLLLGIAITALLQSSTAVNAIIITMTASGLTIGGGMGNAVYFIIVGSNIGTCITAVLSSIGAKPNAKRAALIHFMFNFFGALIFTVLLLCWRTFADTVLTPVFPNDPALRIALFHTLFNVVCTAIFLPVTGLFVKLANVLVKEKPDEVPKKAIADLDGHLLRTPTLALNHLYRETGNMFTYAMETLDCAFNAFVNKDTDAKQKVDAYNEQLAQANKEVVEYLVKLSAASLTLQNEQTISSLHYVYNDIMRIGEIADNFTKYTNQYVAENLVFSEEFLTMIGQMYGKVKQLYVASLQAFLTKNVAQLAQVDKLEDNVDDARKTLIDAHIERLNEGKCQPQNSGVFINLVGNLERVGDHITFIAHSIENQLQSKK